MIDTWNGLPASPATPTNAGPFPCHVGPTLAEVDQAAQPDSWFDSFDLRVTKAIKTTEGHQIQVLVEVFNLFNITNCRGSSRNNYFGFDTTLGTVASPNMNFNYPTNTAGGFFDSGGPRAFQFPARVRRES